MSSLSDDWWENPRTYGPMSDPDGELAKQYFQRKGRWPKGSRQHFEQQRRDEYERGRPFRTEAHPSVDSGFGSVMIRLRQQKMAGRISLGSSVLDSMRVQQREVLDRLFEDLVYDFQAKVLREDLPGGRVEESTLIRADPVYVKPATWRDHLKLTHGHRWWARLWVRRRPARVVEVPLKVVWRVRHTVSVERFRLYPHADIRVEDKLGHGYLNVPIYSTMTFELASDFQDRIG